MALLTIGICVLSQGNTIHARETNDDEQTTQHAAAMTIENKSEGSNISHCTYSCIWFGNCLLVLRRRILIAVRKEK